MLSLFSVCSGDNSRTPSELSLAFECEPPVRRVRQAAQHETDPEEAQGTTAPSAVEQRRLWSMSESVPNAEFAE